MFLVCVCAYVDVLNVSMRFTVRFYIYIYMSIFETMFLQFVRNNEKEKKKRIYLYINIHISFPLHRTPAANKSICVRKVSFPEMTEMRNLMLFYF